jgi:hypothetical protein
VGPNSDEPVFNTYYYIPSSGSIVMMDILSFIIQPPS